MLSDVSSLFCLSMAKPATRIAEAAIASKKVTDNLGRLPTVSHRPVIRREDERAPIRVGVNSIISTPTPTPEVSTPTPTPTPTPAKLQNINSNSNSNSGGSNSNSNSNSGKSPEYQLQLQLQLRRFQLQLQFQLRRFQLQFQLQLRSFKSNPNSISNPINLVQLNYHYQITMWNIVWIKWRYAVDICHVVPNLDQTGQHWHSRW